MNNLILCGFMGCGKTTVGKLLSRRLRMEYIDLDAELEAEAGMPIPEIFAQYGEAYFRELEHEAIKGLAKRIRCVVSTGGGAMTFARNVSAIDRRDAVVFLDAAFETCYARIKDSDRPIVRRSTAQALHELFLKRRAAYLCCSSFCVDANLPAEQLVDTIILLYNAGTV
ncbi:shikimate kinase [Oscillospiraceae bacterium PP1C4]